MDVDTAKALTEALVNALGIKVDSRNKITAFELLLRERDTDLFERYTTILDEVRRNPPTSINIAALEKLQEKLIQG